MSITDMLKEGAEAAKEIAEDIVEKAEDVIGKVLGDDEPTCMELATAMYQMMGEGKMLEAFDKYYHDDVVMVEATGDVREGKETTRKFEEQWLASVKEHHGGGVHAITANEEAGVTMVETWFEATFQDGNRMKMEEVAVQHWKDGQVIRERFYYNAPS